MKDGEEHIPIVLDYRCKRCGAPFTRAVVIVCMLELSEHERSYHHCDDGGVGIGELVGFHDRSPETVYMGSDLPSSLDQAP